MHRLSTDTRRLGTGGTVDSRRQHGDDSILPHGVRVREREDTATSVDDALDQCAVTLKADGALAALRYLNLRTRFRYTGVYHVEPPLLRNLYLFDRENPHLNVSGEIAPLEVTYCGIGLATNAPFATTDAPQDERLLHHAARESIISYSGVPIRLTNGQAWGSLCHFDVRPRLLSAEELRLLEATAELLGHWVAESGA